MEFDIRHIGRRKTGASQIIELKVISGGNCIVEDITDNNSNVPEDLIENLENIIEILKIQNEQNKQ